MNIRIQSVHFDATEKLQAFIEKKVGKIAKRVATRPLRPKWC